jgi:Alpha/beta hydrolase of unknown function (DUF900)
VCTFVLLMYFVTWASAQGTPRVVSEPCKHVQSTSTRDLDTRIAALHSGLSTLKSNLLSVPAGAREQAERNIRSTKETLIDLLFSRECLRRDLQSDHFLVRDEDSIFGTRGPPPWVTVTTYYGTNREETGTEAGTISYGPNRAPRLGYGKAEVSLPTERPPGSLPLPSLWRFELNPDPSKHFILKTVEPLGSGAIRAQVRAALSRASSKSVFVHGFNVAFTEAALRTAQLAHDMSFPGVPFFFSWPSAGETTSYFRDEEIAQLSEATFNQMLNDVAELGATEIFLIAHSWAIGS